MAEPARTIVIREVAGRFGVTVRPPIAGECLDFDYDELSRARGYASGLRMVRGWPVRDGTGGAS
jgi:hypothetical protein